MGKITVKHYINTKINPINGEFPVYVQLTYNRKSNFIKSFTNISLSEGTIIHYSNKTITEIEKELNHETLKGIELTQIKLTREKIEIEKAFEIIDNRLKNKDDFKQRGIKDYLQILMTPLESVINKECWIRTFNTTDKEKEPDYYNFLLSFNKDMSLWDSLWNMDMWICKPEEPEDLKKGNYKYKMVGENFTLENFVKREHISLWNTTKPLLNTVFYNSEPLLIDYFLFDINNKIDSELNNNTEEVRESYKKDTELLINSIIERCLNIIKIK